MRQGWECKKLGEVGSIVTGSTPSTKDDANYNPKEYCFVKPSDLPTSGYALLDSTEFYVSSKGLAQSRELPVGSVLVSCIGSIGKVGILGRVACSNQQINAIIPNETIDSKCLAYIICANRFKLEAMANAPVVPIINKTDFSKVTIPLPPKSTQQAIVSELDKINELIRLKNEQLKDYDNLAQSIFYEMFGDPVENEKGWEVKKLGDITEVGTGSTPSRNNESNYVGDIPWIKSTEVCNCNIYDVQEHISDEALNSSNCTIYPIDTILIAMYGQGKTRGQIAMMKIEACTNQAVAAILPSERLNPYFLYLHLHLMYEHIRSMARGGNQANLNLSLVKSIRIILPPLPLQQTFASRIEAIERQKAEVQKSITELETLLASRMQYWFE